MTVPASAAPCGACAWRPECHVLREGLRSPAWSAMDLEGAPMADEAVGGLIGGLVTVALAGVVVAMLVQAWLAPPFERDARLEPLATPRAADPSWLPEAKAALVSVIAQVDEAQLIAAIFERGCLVQRQEAGAWDETYTVADEHCFASLDAAEIQALRRRFAAHRTARSLGHRSSARIIVDACDAVAVERRLPPVSR